MYFFSGFYYFVYDSWTYNSDALMKGNYFLLKKDILPMDILPPFLLGE